MARGEKAKDPTAQKGIQSIEVGYRVMLAIQRGPGSLQLVEIARRAGLSPGATHNYLVSFIRTGLVEQGARGLYRLGPSAFALSMASFRQLDGFEHVRNEADILHQVTGQSTAVSVWSQAGPVSVYVRKAESIVMYEFRPGLVPMLRTAVGLLYMGYLEPSRTEEIIGRELAASHRPIADTAAIIRAARQQIERWGYSFFNAHDEAFGHAALSAPVWHSDREISFALDVIGHASEIDPARAPKYLEGLLEGAGRASMRLRNLPVSSSVSIDPVLQMKSGPAALPRLIKGRGTKRAR